MPIPRLPMKPFVVVALAALTACSTEATTGDAPAEQRPNASPPSSSSGSTGSPGDGSGTAGGTSSGANDADRTPGGTPVATHGALRVASGKVVGKDDKPVALRGMSLFWSQWGSAFWNASVVSTLRSDWQATVVRAAMGIESGGYLEDNAREKQRVTTIVDAAIAQGIYVIVDWHDHNAEQHVDAAKSFFGGMAETYGDTPNVIFEIYNEPVDVSWSTVRSYAETVTSTIRSRGGKNLVIVGSPHWSQDVDLAANDPVTDSNTAYALHFYANTAAHQAPLRTKALTAIGKGLALFATEWGTSSADGNGATNESESQAWLSFLKGHDIGWCNWSLFDKPEAASALVPGASTTGPWDDSSLTASGTFVKKSLTSQ